MMEYLKSNPDGTKAEAYSDSLACRYALAFGPASSEEDLNQALSYTRSQEAKDFVIHSWKEAQSRNRSARKRVKSLSSSHFDVTISTILSHTKDYMVGVQYRYGRQQDINYLIGLNYGMDVPYSSISLLLEPYLGVSYNIPRIKSSIQASVVANIPFDFIATKIRLITPELAMDYGVSIIPQISLHLIARATPFPYYDAKRLYETTTVDYSELKPVIDQRFRYGFAVYFHFLNE